MDTRARRRPSRHRGGPARADAPGLLPEAQEAAPGGAHRAVARRWWLRCWLWCEAAWADFLFLILPSECLVCGAEDHALCPACARDLRNQTRAPFRAEQSAPALVDVDGHVLLPVMAAGEYRDALATTILAFKNHGRTGLAGTLAPALLRALESALGPADGGEPGRTSSGGPWQRGCTAAGAEVLLVPVPGSGAGWRRRGYEPVTLLLARLQRTNAMPPGTAVSPVLRLKYRPP